MRAMTSSIICISASSVSSRALRSSSTASLRRSTSSRAFLTRRTSISSRSALSAATDSCKRGTSTAAEAAWRSCTSSMALPSKRIPVASSSVSSSMWRRSRTSPSFRSCCSPCRRSCRWASSSCVPRARCSLTSSRRLRSASSAASSRPTSSSMASICFSSVSAADVILESRALSRVSMACKRECFSPSRVDWRSLSLLLRARILDRLGDSR
mmetsp:Transcript_12645/g.39907  ORF Transcript_12645/g.39907 Transcript_12645/m.39907 type:complete len:212 (+) Transcript_12645:1396-2031(+)